MSSKEKAMADSGQPYVHDQNRLGPKLSGDARDIATVFSSLHGLVSHMIYIYRVHGINERGVNAWKLIWKSLCGR